MDSLPPDIWRLIAAAILVDTGEDPNPVVGTVCEAPSAGFKDLRLLDDWNRPQRPRPFYSDTSYKTFKKLEKAKAATVRDFFHLTLVCRDMRAAIESIWVEVYRTIAPVYCFFDRRTRRIEADMRPMIGMPPVVWYGRAPLPAKWYRLRLGLLFQNPTKRQRKMASRDKARARVVIGYESKMRVKLKSHYARVRRELRMMERNVG
jgi:hypothetical protein